MAGIRPLRVPSTTVTGCFREVVLGWGGVLWL